jgi:hypothetical protein
MVSENPYIIIFAIAIILIIAISYFIYKNFKSNFADSSPNAKAILIIGTVMIILGALPLLIYPFALLANIMQLASFGMLKQSEIFSLKSILMLLFIISTTVYPMTFIYSFKKFPTATNKILISLLPIIHLGITALAFQLGITFDK